MFDGRFVFSQLMDFFRSVSFNNGWIAISAYVLIAILKRELKLDRSQHEILQILRVTRFEKTADLQGLLKPNVPQSPTTCRNQLGQFDF